MQVNLPNNTIKSDVDSDISDSYVFDLNKNLDLTQDLTPDSLDFSNSNTNFVDSKKQSIKVNAFKLDKKTIVIKGFNEEIDNSLLKTIDLNIKNVDLSTSDSFGLDIIPVTIDIALNNDDVFELNGDENNDIFEYEVVSGDNISSIADKFNISADTILWANDLNRKSSIKVGQKLVILPVSGISYKVKSGDTIGGLSTRFGVTERDIIAFNKTDGDKLIIGENIIIPGGKINNQNNQSNKNTENVAKNPSKNTQKNISSGNNTMVRPINGVKTQGIHGNNAIDFGANIGTPIYSAMSGIVTLVRGDGAWNGGYGNYIVIKHNNGVQTLYAHLNNVSVSKGQNVERGEVIAKSGNTGRSTGPHLHFEVRGAKNPF